MTKAIVVMTLLFLTWSVPPAKAQGVDARQETTISRLVIPLFGAHVDSKDFEKFWLVRKAEVQRNIVSLLEDRSFLEGVQSSLEVNFGTSKSIIVSEARAKNADGVLLGEFQGENLALNLLSGLTGRSMGRTKIPLPDIAHLAPNEIALTIVKALKAAFRYSGYVVATHNNELRINLGKKHGLKINTSLDVFDFLGNTPTFSSPTQKIGQIEVTRIGDYAAIAKIISSQSSIQPYAKVKLALGAEPVAPAPTPSPSPNVKATVKNLKKSHNTFLISGGVDFFAITTQVMGGTAASIQQRDFVVPLSPAAALGFSYSRLSLNGSFSSLNNSSNTVNFYQGTGLYQLFSKGSRAMSMYTSLGVYYSQYSVTPAPNSTSLLASTSTYSPVFVEKFQWIIGSKSKLYGSARLFYPLFSNDAVNGSSSSLGSFGGGLEAGWVQHFTKDWGVNLGVQGHYFMIQNQGGGTIDEMEYSVFAHLFYLF